MIVPSKNLVIVRRGLDYGRQGFNQWDMTREVLKAIVEIWRRYRTSAYRAGTGLARRERGLDVARVAALAAVLEARTAAGHVGVDGDDLVLDALCATCSRCGSGGPTGPKHLDQPFQRARERLDFPLAAHRCRAASRVGAVRSPGTRRTPDAAAVRDQLVVSDAGRRVGRRRP